MNFTSIEKQYPEAYAQFRERPSEQSNPTTFFDDLRIFVVVTYNPGHTMQWGWEVWSPDEQFHRHEGAYMDRADALSGGWTRAFSELNRLLLAGNA